MSWLRSIAFSVLLAGLAAGALLAILTRDWWPAALAAALAYFAFFVFAEIATLAGDTDD